MSAASLFAYLWLAYFGAAALLLLLRVGNPAVLIGLLGLGAANLAFQMPRWDPEFGVTVREHAEALRVLGFASTLVLIVGVLVLAVRRRPAQVPASASTAGANLSTLLIPRNATNTFVRAEALRDEVCARLAAQARAAGIGIIEQKSNAHSGEVWLQIHYLLPQPDPGLSLRASVEVKVQRFDFHRFEHLFDVTARVGAMLKHVDGVIAIDDGAAEQIHRFLTTPGARLRLARRVRVLPWQFWRKRNKVERIRGDWVGIAGAVLGVLLLAIPVLGILLAAGVFLALYLRSRRRPIYTLNGGRPLSDPRELRWMDSWQATVAGLAGATGRMIEGVTQRIRSGAPADLSVGVERFGYWSVDGQIERDQLVVRYRRALGFVHVVPYGDHLYVSWECQLNRAAWAEETLARGVDRVSGQNVHANRVVYGVQQLNEYDLADANFLSEWLHEAVKRELQLQAAEHRIDLEIDFTVQRESRKDAIAAPAPAPAAKPGSGALLGGRFKRVN